MNVKLYTSWKKKKDGKIYFIAGFCSIPQLKSNDGIILAREKEVITITSDKLIDLFEKVET